jgi:asparagine synthase (glutamine-hydrolysing)
VGVLTGGGLDSAGMLGLACRWAANGTGRSAFAVALDYEAEGDDRPHLAALERHLRCEVVRVPPEDAASRMVLINGVDASPFPWPTGPLEVELLAVAKAHGAERCLSGAGGDELFNGDPRSLSTLVKRGHVLGALARARRLQGFGRPRFFAWLVRPLLAELQPKGLRAWRARRHSPALPAWCGPVVQAFVRERASIDTIAAYRDYVAWLRHQEIVASGCDLREPFLDEDVVAEVASLPSPWLVDSGVRRGLFRQAMRGILPDSVRMRLDKARFEPALARFFLAGNGAECMRSAGSLECLKKLGLARSCERLVCDPKRVESWLGAWPALAVEAFLQADRREGSEAT